MYRTYTDDELEERYRGQMDDTSASQYAYEYGITLYEIGCRHYIEDMNYAGLVIYWLRQYIDKAETKPECVKRSRYIITKLLREYPELREDM